MKAAVLTDYRKVQWLDIEKPRISDTEVLVEVSYASICGSDQHVYNGDFGERIKLPLIQGHEFVGKIAETGSKVKNFKQGQRVAVDPIYWCGNCPACRMGHYPACRNLKLLGIDSNGGFGQFVACKEFMLHKLPDNISDVHAALIEVFAIGFHACNRASVTDGDTIAIFGAGKIGQVILQAVRTKTNNTIFLIDVLDNRLDLGAGLYDNIITINSLQQNSVHVIAQQTDGSGVDIAFEAIGHAQKIKDRFHPVRQCIQSIRPAGTVCVLGLADEPAPIVTKELIFKEAKLLTSRVSHGEFTEVIENISKGRLKPDALITCRMHASQAQKGFELLETRPADYLKILLELS